MKQAHLELFEENDEVTLIKRELNRIRKHFEKIRRSACSRHNKLATLCVRIKEQNEEMRRRIEKLEKLASSRTESPGQDEDFLKKLFEEAYQSSS